MNESNGDQNPESHELVHDSLTHRQQRVYIEAHCTCGEKFLASGSNEDRAKEALLGKHLKHRREVGVAKAWPKEEYPWREGEEGIITRHADILALDLPEGERERRKEILESTQQFLRRLFSNELDIELWGDWLLYVLSELYSASFDHSWEEGIESYRKTLKRLRDEIDKWLAVEVELPDDLTDIV